MHLVKSRNVSIEFKKITSKCSCWVSLPACANILFSSSYKTCFLFPVCQREERSHSAKQAVFSTPLLFIALLSGGKAFSEETAGQRTWCLCFGRAWCCSDQCSTIANWQQSQRLGVACCSFDDWQDPGDCSLQLFSIGTPQKWRGKVEIEKLY